MILTFLILTLSVFIPPERSIKNDIEKEYSYTQYEIVDMIDSKENYGSLTNFLESCVNNIEKELYENLKFFKNNQNNGEVIKKNYKDKKQIIQNIINDKELSKQNIKVYDVIIFIKNCEELQVRKYYILNKNNEILGTVNYEKTSGLIFTNPTDYTKRNDYNFYYF